MVNLFLNECEKFGYTLDKSEIKINTGMDRVSIPIPKVNLTLSMGMGKNKNKNKNKNKIHIVYIYVKSVGR